MISTSFKSGLLALWCILTYDNQFKYVEAIKVVSEEICVEANELLDENLIKLNQQITDTENIIIKSLVLVNETFVTLEQSEERQNWILTQMCIVDILSNLVDKAVSLFNSKCGELSISSIIGELYTYGDLTMFKQIIDFINKLEIKYTKINGIIELYKILIDNDDFNIVNGILLLDSVLTNGKDITQNIEKIIMKQVGQLVEKKDYALFFKYSRNFERSQLIVDMIPTFVSSIYANNSKNIQLVLKSLQEFHYFDQKLHVIIALSRQISEQKHTDDNGSTLAVMYYIIHYTTFLSNHRNNGDQQPLLDVVQKSLPANFLPLLYNDICIFNKHYGRYLYVDSDDHIRDNLHRPILTRKSVNPSLMYICSMKFKIRFQCREANCDGIVIENTMHPEAEFLFAENGTIYTYKGNFPDEKLIQAEWRLESDGEYFQLKNLKFGTYLQMDEIIEKNEHEMSLVDITLDLKSDKTKWKIEKCKEHLNVESFQELINQ